MARLVIKQHKPLHLIVAIVALSVFLSLTTWILLDASYWSYIKSQVSFGKESKAQWELNQTLKSENSELRERLTKLERVTQIDRQTAENLQREIKHLQNKIYDLKGELEFYQGVMSEARQAEGLNVQGLHIVALSQPRNYQFKLILTNVTKSDKVAKGKVDMLLEGMQGTKPKILKIKNVISEGSLDLSYNFKHFSRLEGVMILPEEFVPHRVIVKLQAKSKKVSNIEKAFDWFEAAN